ncbi:Fc.00g030240.m01.CDS01 [Cosmosporella sp. VM-42]
MDSELPIPGHIFDVMDFEEDESPVPPNTPDPRYQQQHFRAPGHDLEGTEGQASQPYPVISGNYGRHIPSWFAGGWSAPFLREELQQFPAAPQNLHFQEDARQTGSTIPETPRSPSPYVPESPRYFSESRTLSAEGLRSPTPYTPQSPRIAPAPYVPESPRSFTLSNSRSSRSYTPQIAASRSHPPLPLFMAPTGVGRLPTVIANPDGLPNAQQEVIHQQPYPIIPQGPQTNRPYAHVVSMSAFLPMMSRIPVPIRVGGVPINITNPDFAEVLPGVIVQSIERDNPTRPDNLDHDIDVDAMTPLPPPVLPVSAWRPPGGLITRRGTGHVIPWMDLR